MKNMKALTILLAATMLTLTGCGGGSNNAGGNAANDQPANEASTNTATGNDAAANNASTGNDATGNNAAATNDAAPAPTDLGGREIHISAWWDGMPKGDTADSKKALDKLHEVEKKYNVKIKYDNIPFDKYMDKFTTAALSGTPMADISILEFKRALAPIKQGLLLPLSEYTQGTSDINNEQEHTVKLPQLLGDEYFFGGKGISTVGMFYNRDLFKKLGLPDPQELYAGGQWNWDKFLEIAKQATTDTNNDGKPDTWGFANSAPNAARDFGVTNGALFVNDDLTIGFSDPKMIETLEFINRLYNKENVVKVKKGDKNSWDEINTFKDGDVAMSNNFDWNVGGLPFEIGVVPNPQGPSGDGKYTYANTAQNGWVIPKGVKDPQVVYQIYEELQDIPSTEEYFGQNGLEALFKNQQDIDMTLQHINNTGRISLEEGIADYPFYAIMDDVIKKNQSVTATVEKYKAPAQAALDKMK
ncbi:ABC transporter substrate-binding protein [Paenibacillus sacheonensis]|uniref:Extracellular solute-binding protein n=1 Tax=Paenibacillus sacheonensis TaxID=742054 RepID=A0A7X4YLF8_9BACL|nr:extracellular solute-binding protein [Paenibacillus sacheonensis]MBM7568705.1 multiple sugar transport system substrate-binding protein [Paenibacillus sacheonensis]NBC68457.1 extracellular solute-binding protein [Paenibacillus sacheonensis]